MGVRTGLMLRNLAWITFLLGFAGAEIGVTTPALSQFFRPNSRVDNIFAEWDRADSPGCSVAIARNGKIIYARGYGMADLDHEVRNRPSTVFHAASLAKQITAMSILLLIQQYPQRISLDDYVNAHISELANVPEQFTIRQMLQHISGIRDQQVLVTLAGWRLSDDTVTRDDVLTMVKRMKTLNFSPGQRFLYSNTGYTLAGEIVHRISGLTLAEFARTHVFNPLEMKHTTFTPTHGQIVRERAYGYRVPPYPNPDPLEIRMADYDLTGPTNLLTTVGDLIRWQNNFDHKTVGGENAIAEMLSQAVLSDGHTVGYGLGVFLQKYRGLDIVEHDGRDAGYRSHLIRFPAKRFAVACLCNLALPEDKVPLALVRKIADIYLDFPEPLLSSPGPEPLLSSSGPAPAVLSCPAPATSTATSSAGLPDYQGRYYSSEIDATYDIESGPSLQLMRPKYPAKTLTPISADKFTTTNLGAPYSGVLQGTVTVQFSRNGSGQIDGFCMDGPRLENFQFRRQ
jgi:CubicO group peptidase (beta-lactamase class C family)